MTAPADEPEIRFRWEGRSAYIGTLPVGCVTQPKSETTRWRAWMGVHPIDHRLCDSKAEAMAVVEREVAAQLGGTPAPDHAALVQEMVPLVREAEAVLAHFDDGSLSELRGALKDAAARAAEAGFKPGGNAK